MPVVDLVAALAQEIADHVLARTFGAAGRGNRDKIPGGGQLRVETGIDGVEDSLAGIAGVHCVTVPVGAAAMARRTPIKPYFRSGLQTFLIAFRIAGAPIE